MTQDAQKTDLRERCAHAVLAGAYPHMGVLTAEKIADAVLAIASPAIIEKCAKRLELFSGDGKFCNEREAELVAYLASAIRALAEKPR